MRLLVVRADDGTVAGNATVTFAQQPSSHPDRASPSTSEQSVVVRPDGNAVVVQNWLPNDRVPALCAWLGAWLPDKARPACPFLLGALPLAGVQQLGIDLATGRVEGTGWVRADVQCASSIPAADPTAVYCLGMRPRALPARRLLGRPWAVWPWAALYEAFLAPRNEFVVRVNTGFDSCASTHARIPFLLFPIGV
jgi:hypothetical protein